MVIKFFEHPVNIKADFPLADITLFSEEHPASVYYTN